MLHLKISEYKNDKRTVVNIHIKYEAPWTIGWNEILCCQKSLDLLDKLSIQLEGKLKVILRGRP